MPEISTFIAVFSIGIAAGTVGAMVGGGSLLSIPVLILVGLPPQIAIATDRFAGLGAAVAAGYKFWRGKRIVWHLVPLLALLSLIGSLAGAKILVSVDPQILHYVVGVLVLLLLPVIFLTREVGLRAQKVGRARILVGSVLYVSIQVLAGFFGGGTGTLIFYTLMLFFGVTIIQVAATQTVPFIVLTVAATLFFAAHRIIDYRLGIVLMGGTAVGGYLGAHIAMHVGEKWVRRLFAIIVIVVGARLLVG
jgi:uncharacterized membrane protein YfcA